MLLMLNLKNFNLIKYEKMSAEDAIQHVREKRHGSIQSFVQVSFRCSCQIYLQLFFFTRVKLFFELPPNISTMR